MGKGLLCIHNPLAGSKEAELKGQQIASIFHGSFVTGTTCIDCLRKTKHARHLGSWLSAVADMAPPVTSATLMS